MYYVGIDVAKEKHYVSVIDEQGDFVIKPFWIYSDGVGLNELVKKLNDISLTYDDFILALESTGAYSENIYEYFTELGFKIILLNSYQTAKFRDLTTMKKVKNDAIDSLVIAGLIKSNQYKESYVSNEDYQSLKVLVRLKSSLADKIKSIKREISTVMAIVNPEINKVFPNLFTKSALAIIKEYPTAIDLQSVTVKKLTKIFRHIKGNNFNEDKAKYLIDLANLTIYSGRAKDARSLMITYNIRTLELLCQEKDDVEIAIQNILDIDIDNKPNSPIDNLKTIPGVSDKTIAALLGECGKLNRFESAKAFIGYLGLYPTLYQSGNSSVTGRLAMRGIPIAKHALYMAAVSSVRHNIEMLKLFRDKVSRGKSKKEALIIIAKKLATIIYSIFKYNTPYNPNRVFIPYRK